MSEQFKITRRGRSLTAVSLLAAFGLLLLLAGGGAYAPTASGASAYQFPGRGDDLAAGDPAQQLAEQPQGKVLKRFSFEWI